MLQYCVIVRKLTQPLPAALTTPLLSVFAQSFAAETIHFLCVTGKSRTTPVPSINYTNTPGPPPSQIPKKEASQCPPAVSIKPSPAAAACNLVLPIRSSALITRISNTLELCIKANPLDAPPNTPLPSPPIFCKE